MGQKLEDLQYIGFPNGMTLEEGVHRAAEWWDKTGREVITRWLGEEPQDQGGMMAGVEWNKLELKEQHRVVSAWYAEIGSKL